MAGTESDRSGGRVHAAQAGLGWNRVPTCHACDWAARDLSLARLLEGHVDALAILNEAGREPESGAIYGVWAARPPGGGTTARLAPDGWQLTGTKPFCSGSTRLDRALVTAECGDGYRLFDISVAENVVRVHPGSWPAVGMADSLSDTLDFGGAPVPADRAVGPPGFYLERPGFWFGATGVAACWYGGARGLVGHVLRAWARISELGNRGRLRRGAHRPDAPGSAAGGGRDRCGSHRRFRRSTSTRALVVRHAVHHAAQEVLVHAAAAGGARPFCLDADQARRVADLYVYLAQYRGPQDANALGAIASDGWPWT